ncbi:putative toxin-antitoxin system antitoxin component (TIGR02293 family) [Rhodopirellula rubra]|uniref:Putative toxin-antitoxin system antitoxin component (TIGR02293 family) n=1 Tax=Aporhodopirellula rubra TaxID=980271 RepID=A0A7W5H6P4_9BACT|nr:putative toxin-antitoxin system antitoxin component (TIGR02293 family) [Aporhodopirellula rubra]
MLKLNLEMADFSSFVPFIRNGFSRQCFDEFLSGTTIASAITRLSAFDNLAEDAKELSPEASDCLLRIARVYAEALELFGEKEDVAQWMVTKSLTLGDQTPLELLDTTVGFELVYHELKRLQYGIAG